MRPILTTTAACLRRSSQEKRNKTKSLKYLALSRYFLKIEAQLIYNVVLIYAVQKSDSVIHIYIFFYVLFHYGLSQEIEYSSLSYTDFQTQRIDSWLPSEKAQRRGTDWESGVSRCKLLHLEWINNKKYFILGFHLGLCLLIQVSQT